MKLSRKVLLERSDLSINLEDLMEGSDDSRGLKEWEVVESAEGLEEGMKKEADL